MNAVKLFKSKWFRRSLLTVLGLLSAIVVYGLLQLIEPIGISLVVSDAEISFSGQVLLVASDADMVATAYADAKLDRVAGIEDALSVVKLPFNPSEPAVSSLQVSNSVMSWPQIIAVSPNGQRAYVVEVRSRPDDGIQELEDIDQMPEGKVITVVDISDPLQPKIIEAVDIGLNPEHVSISPDGRFLAVNLVEAGRELLIVQLQSDGRLGRRWYFPLQSDGTRQDNRAAIWHPSGDYLAMTQNNNRRVGVYRVSVENDEVTLEPVGDPIEVGNHLSNPQFISDGRFLLVPDLRWSEYNNPTLSALLNPKGEMIAVRFDPTSEKPLEVVSRVEVGLSPEGIALSPDNTLIATVNMRRTYLPNFLPAWRGKPFSSLSLVKFDPDSGQLTTIGDEYGFEGLLPEQATFDTTGSSLAVVVYNYREPSPKTGAIEFWNVITEETPRLERTGYTLDVVRGAHDIVLVP